MDAVQKTMSGNREWILLNRPAASGAVLSDFELRDCEAPTAGDGQIVVRAHMMSVDPAMRTMMAGADLYEEDQESFDISYYRNAWTVGGNPRGRVIGIVESSSSPDFVPGDMVKTRGAWKLLQAVPAGGAEKLDASGGIPLSAHLGALGGTGLAAYLPVVHIGEPKAGEVAFVSGAAGATGMSAAQALRNLGCDVIGSAGTDAKVAVLEKLGVRAFNYKTHDVATELRRIAPSGIDIYFDNVGGPTLEAAIEVMREFGRIIACGSISQYDRHSGERYGVKNLFHIVTKRIRFQGYITDLKSFTQAQWDDANATLEAWLRDGKLTEENTFTEGFDQLPAALLGLFEGKNTGKMIVREPLPARARL